MEGEHVLIIAGSFEVAPERRDEFIASRSASMTASRAENGCLEYVFAADPLVPGRVVLYERWESKEDLAAHLASQKAAREAAAASSAPAGVPVLASEIAQYEISVVGALGS
jgi:quinol monooxygenase YgiN